MNGKLVQKNLEKELTLLQLLCTITDLTPIELLSTSKKEAIELVPDLLLEISSRKKSARK